MGPRGHRRPNGIVQGLVVPVDSLVRVVRRSACGLTEASLMSDSRSRGGAWGRLFGFLGCRCGDASPGDRVESLSP